MTKKLMMLCVAAFVAIGAFAATETVNGITWTYTVSGGKASVSSGTIPTATTGAITIPSTLGGYSVTSIGESAFEGCSSLTSVTIPDSVTSIRESAFYGCSSLTSVTIPDSVMIIEGGAFYDCSSLTSVTIPDSVTGIGFWAFSGCSSLTSVTIPDSVTSIEESAFEGCSSLTSVTIPDSVTSIGFSAFGGCSSLISVTIPDSVTDIWGSPFKGCSSLQSFTVDSGNDYYKSVDGLLLSKDGKVLILCPGGKKSVVIPDSVTIIRFSAFEGCSSLTSVTIPDSVTRIGEYAFEGCSSLTSVTIPDSVTSIEEGAFYGCSSLTSVTIPDGVTRIGRSAFEGCSSLTSVAIPDSVTSIGYSAFEGCSSLTSVTIPDGVTSIGSSAFYGCSSLTSVTIPDGVTRIWDYAFEGCSSLTSVTIPDRVTSIGSSAFYGCSSLTSVTIPDRVTSIDSSAFAYCSSLTSVTIPDSVTSIGADSLCETPDVFRGCENLTHVTMPVDLVTKMSYIFPDLYNKLTNVSLIGEGAGIPNNAFEGYASLTEIVIPDGVTAIGTDVFNGCTNLAQVTLPLAILEGNVGQILQVKKNNWIEEEDGVYQSNDINDSQYTSMTVEVEGPLNFVFDWKVSSESNYDRLNWYLDGSQISEISGTGNGWQTVNYSIPKGSHTLRWEYLKDGSVSSGDDCGWVRFTGSVSDCMTMSTLFPDSYAAITNVVLTGDGSEIPEGAFAGCVSLRSFIVPDGVTKIGNNAFSDCELLSEIVIPESVKNFGLGIFSGCTNITHVTLGFIPNISFAPGFYEAEFRSMTSFDDSKSIIDNSRGIVLSADMLTAPDAEEYTMYGYLADMYFEGGVEYGFLGYYDDKSSIKIDGKTVIAPAQDECESQTYFVSYPVSGWHQIELRGWNNEAWGAAWGSCEGIMWKKDSGAWRTFADSGDGLLFRVPNFNPRRKTIKEIFPNSYRKIKTIVLKGDETEISDNTFADCESLESFVIPDSVTKIGDYAFYHCFSLTNVVLGNSVTSIGLAAFAGCSSLDSLGISTGITSVNDDAFANSKLREFVIKYRNKQSSVVVLNANGGMILLDASSVKKNLASETLGALPSPIRSRYKFLGWYTAPEGGTKVSASTKVTGDVTYYAQWVYDGSVTVSAIVADGCETMGKVTGGKTAKAGTKLTLKATPNKGYVFSHWDGPLDESQDPRNPSISYVVGEDDAEFIANFISVEEDWVDVWMDCSNEYVTNEEISDIYIGVDSGSLATIKVTGLPTGLKYTAKPVYDRNGDLLHEANTVYGTPTKSGVYTVTVTATTAGKKTDTCSAVIVVRTDGERMVKLSVPTWYDGETDTDVIPGKVTGSGIYTEGKKVTLKATANKGFVFAGWSGFEGTEHYHSPSFSYTVVDSDMDIEAIFIPVEEDWVYVWADYSAEYATNEEISDIYIHVDSGSLATLKVTGLPAGLKYTAKSIYSGEELIHSANTIYGKPTKSGVYTVTVTAITAGKKTDVQIMEFIVRKDDERAVNLMVESWYDEENEIDVVPGKVTGSGIYTEGKKAILKATANKGFVFAGWRLISEYDSGYRNEDWLYGDEDYRSSSLSYEITDFDAKIKATFIPIEEDWVDISLSYNSEYATNEEISDIYIGVDSGSYATIKISGLPVGLKYTAKPIYNQDGELIHETNTIYGTPTKSGVYTVTVTATTAGKMVDVEVMEIVIRKSDERMVKLCVPAWYDWYTDTEVVPGKVTGSGIYAEGIKVALKATANKGFVFVGWRDVNSGDCVYGVEDYRSPSLSYIMTDSDMEIEALFEPVEYDDTLVAYVEGNEITSNANDNNFVADGTIILPIQIESHSLPKAAVSGLPAGMKYTDKALTVKATKTEEAYDVPANAIYGTPTKPGFYTVTVKLTNTTIKKAIEKKFTIEVPNLTAADHLFRDYDEYYIANDIGDKYSMYVGVTEFNLPRIRLAAGGTLKVSGLPAGLKYDASTGVVEGIATKEGTYTVYLSVGVLVSTFTIEVMPLPDWVVGTFEGGTFEEPDCDGCKLIWNITKQGKVSIKAFSSDDNAIYQESASGQLTRFEDDVFVIDLSRRTDRGGVWIDYISRTEVNGVEFGVIDGDFSYWGATGKDYGVQNIWSKDKEFHFLPEIYNGSEMIIDLTGWYEKASKNEEDDEYDDWRYSPVDYSSLHLKFGKNGAVTAAFYEPGALNATGTASATLMPYNRDGDTVQALLTIAIAPKGRHSITLALYLEIDTSRGIVYGDDIEVVDYLMEAE